MTQKENIYRNLPYYVFKCATDKCKNTVYAEYGGNHWCKKHLKRVMKQDAEER